MSRKMKIGCLGFSVLVAIGLAVSMSPIPQDTTYHLFVNKEMWWAIPNAQDVLSNIVFIIAGILGLMKIGHRTKTEVTPMWRFFFSAVTLVALGSAYYHWLPTNDTLVWDRLPITLCFTALTACVCAERLGVKIGRLLFLPLVVSGVLSVFYWWFSESCGFGDLRPYILIQVIPMILIPLMLVLFPKTPDQNRPYWLLLASYIIAKGFELNDDLIFNLTNQIISGHTLKHLVVGVGIMILPANGSQELNDDGESAEPCLKVS